MKNDEPVNWEKVSDERVEGEFYRLANTLVAQGDIDVLVDLIPKETQRSFVVSWHEEDELDEE